MVSETVRGRLTICLGLGQEFMVLAGNERDVTLLAGRRRRRRRRNFIYAHR